MRQQATSTKRVFANWYAIAGYLYVLHLNGASLAWEYLRRNTDYRNDWRHCDPASTVFAERWGLAFAEDPYRDAETVRPLWQFDAEQAVRIVADGSLRSERFSVWSIPGRKALLCEENRIVLTSFLPNRSVTMAIPRDVCDGERFAYVIESGSGARSRWSVVEHHIEALH